MQIIYSAITVALWGVWTLFNKLAVDRMHPLWVQIITSIIGLFSIPIFYYLIPKGSTPTVSGTGYAVLSAISVIAATGTYLMAVSKADISTVTGYTSMYPLVTYILAIIFLGETFTLVRLCGLFFIVGGAFLLSR